MPATEVRVPFVNLAAQHQPIKAELMEAIGNVIDTGAFVLGDPVGEFEERFAALCGTKHAVAVNSGTDALILALRALNIGPGDEVITSPNSFIATAAAIALTGARPVFVDTAVDFNIDPNQIERAITSRTRAILPVHLTGRPADMDPIRTTAERRGLPIIEDAAQAALASYRGRRAGNLGTIGCFSLHPLKTLNACGDAGILTTNHAALAERLRILRNIGLKTRDECVAWSGNSRLDTMQAAILIVKLRYLQEWTDARRANAAYYRKALVDVPGLTLPMEDRENETSVYHTFMIQTDKRDALKQHLAANGIETAVHYPVPMHLHPAAASLGYQRGAFPTAERQAQRILSLPVWHGLTAQQLTLVVNQVRESCATVQSQTGAARL